MLALLVVTIDVVTILVVKGCHKDSGGNFGPPPGAAQPSLPTVRIMVGQVPLEVEVAATETQRRQGYMFRDPPAAGGMLFVWPVEEPLAFWMMNTRFDIDLAYISADGTIAQTERMHAFRTESVPARRPAKFVLEVPAGWFEKQAVRPGTMVTIPPTVTSREE